ncbi:beta-lactamase family protein [Massilia solisilvae]|uniref:Beta-lactamase family protein n=1 Tax=Massilia solisilvae TaxID=1811225 RepID=A0ABT2BMU4_9BURK|nr:serine hydrolase domain-containing protein [Massilia solisilvae]MCS0609842.1 beta-lactamase family protein [Massilia solisilvae]
MKRTKAVVLVGAMWMAGAVWAQGPLDALNAKFAATPVPGSISIAMVGREPHGGVTSSVSVTGNEGLRPDATFRVASNTKTYVAATVLRLWEDGKIKLDASIRDYVDPATIAALDKDGYDTAHITVRQLLTHTAGIADHTNSKQFGELLATHPETAWTRESTLDALVRWTDPVGKPGEKFYYSDDGYCLLGNIIERLTGKPLARAVHEILGYEKLGLKSTYWETQEPAAPQAGPRAHQLFDDGRDTYGWNPSLDMYGGGGIVADPRDLAWFLYDLFEGKVFKHPETLQLMLSNQGLPADSQYRMGIFEYEANGVKAYWHSGFWGTAAFYVPSQHRAYAFAVTRRNAYKPAFEQMKAYISGK